MGVVLVKGRRGYAVHIAADQPVTVGHGTAIATADTVADVKTKAMRVLLQAALNVSELVASDAVEEG
jgi:hypothetical protein